MFKGNPALTSLGPLFQVMDLLLSRAPEYTSSIISNVDVVDNQALCFPMHSDWALSPSLLSFTATQVFFSTNPFFILQCPSSPCWYPSSDGVTCYSRCTDPSGCGKACAASPIVSLFDLAAYKEQNCTILTGPLVLRGLPQEVDEDSLAVFGSLRYIMGDLIVQSNSFLTSLAFLRALQTATSIVIADNPYLVDARLPNLDTISKSQTTVSNNLRLCPARSVIPDGSSESGCTTLQVEFHIETNCPEFSTFLLGLIASTLQLNVSMVLHSDGFY
jgi:hypothetical protein